MISIIFLEPQTPGNVGALCRSMANFDLTDLIVINPRCDIVAQEAQDRAKHAKKMLRSARIYPSLLALKEKESFDYLIGTTGVLGSDYNIPRTPLTPKQCAEKIAKRPQLKVALIIGREGDGLTNEELMECDCVVTIPTSLQYPVMNASHAASILFYELFQARSSVKSTDHIAPATTVEKKVLLDVVEDVLEQMPFVTEDKRETQRRVWKRLVGKSFMSKREITALIGFMKKMKK